MKTRWKKVYVEVYGFDAIFTVGNAKKIYKKILKKGYTISDLHKEELLGGYEAVTIPLLFKGQNDGFLVWLPEKPKKKAQLATLAHEICHQTSFFWKEIGGTLNLENDEPYCYFLEYLMHEALDFYR